MLNKNEFKNLFDSYFDTIRRYIYYRCGDEDTASDIAQDIFLKVWEKRASLDSEKILPLLYKIANDMVISNYRKSSTKQDFYDGMSIGVQGLSPQDEIQFKELKERYAAALQDMPELQRVTFLLSRNDEMKYQEIAKQLDISVKTVEKRMSGALQFLKEKLL